MGTSPRLPSEPDEVQTKDPQGLDTMELADLWSNLSRAGGIRVLARLTGLAAGTLYKQGEIETDLAPNENPKTARYNPLEVVSRALRRANDMQGVQRARAMRHALAALRHLADLLGYELVAGPSVAAKCPQMATIESLRHVAATLQAIEEARREESPGGAEETDEESREVCEHLTAAIDELTRARARYRCSPLAPRAGIRRLAEAVTVRETRSAS